MMRNTSPTVPSIRYTRAPFERLPFQPSSGHSTGSAVCTSQPARAPYAAQAWPPLPTVGWANRVTPSSFQRDTAAEAPRALKVPVGFTPSSLTHSSPTPTSRAAFGTGIIGVKPSPIVTIDASSRTGRSSRYRHMVGGRRAISSGVTAFRIAARS